MAENRSRRHHSHPRRPSQARPLGASRVDAAAGVDGLDDATPDEALAAEARPDEEFDPEVDPEAPVADAAEQRRPLRSDEDEQVVAGLVDADPADVAEQARGTHLDEDEYR